MKILDVPQSGSQAGTTASRNRFGQYRRTRAIPVNPNTTFQTEARNRLVLFSQNWAGLTDPQRDAWKTYADAHPRTDSLGQTVKLTGLQMYVALNSLLYLTTGTTITVPPSAENAGSVENDSVTADASSNDITGDVNTTVATGTVAVYLSPIVSPGVSFMKDFRYMGLFTAVAGVAAVSIATDYTGRLGNLTGQAGKAIFMKLVPTSANGSFGTEQVYKLIIQA